jgi:asparagine synthase (glutamine-hydrolysing)
MATAPTPEKIAAFRAVFEESLADIDQRTGGESERCLVLSGGVDTCAILAAAQALGVRFGAAVTVVTGASAPDHAFSVAATEEYGMDRRHVVVQLSPQQLMERYLPTCVQILETFDGMTLRNSLVVAAAFHRISQLGNNNIKHAIVGDGADELFGGYSFMWGSADDPTAWKKKRDQLCREWTFATAALARHYGLESHSPYTEPKLVEWALAETRRCDCVGTRPIRLTFGGASQEHVTGKLILRQSYATVASWRRKDPIEVGSGITVISNDEPYWKDEISDEEFAAEAARLQSRGYVIRSKEYLANFRIFDECFGGISKEGLFLSQKGKKRLGLGEGCAGCCYEIEDDKTFCDVCGAYPAQRSSS